MALIPGSTVPARELIVINKPMSGEHREVVAVPGSEIKITFDQNSVSFERSENNLTLTSEEGGTVVLKDFFAVGDKPLPTLQLADGSTIASEDMLTQMNPDFDITTAAGPTPAPPASAGLNAYAGDAGDLLGGVDRLGTLGTNQWDTARSAPLITMAEGAIPFGTAGGAVSPGGGPGGIINPGTPGTYVPFSLTNAVQAHMILADAQLGAARTPESIAHSLRLNAPDFQRLVDNIPSGVVAQGKYGDVSYDKATGQLTYTMTEAGAAKAKANGADAESFRITSTDSKGNIVAQDFKIDLTRGDSESSFFNDGATAEHTGDRLTYGDENQYVYLSARNDTSDMTGTGGAVGLFGDEVDSVTFNDHSSGGGGVQTGQGNDTVAISVESTARAWGMHLNDPIISTGAGDDVVDITSTGLYTGPLANRLPQLFTADLYRKGTAAGFEGQILTGEGNDQVSVTATNKNGLATAMSMFYADNSVLDTGSGDDIIKLSAHSDQSEAYGVHHVAWGHTRDPELGHGEVRIDAGQGNDHIIITASTDGTAAQPKDLPYAAGVVGAAQVLGNDGNDTITIEAITDTAKAMGLSGGAVIDGGTGDDVISITGKGISAGSSVATSLSFIYGGEGDDTVTLDGKVSKSIVDGGDGHDVLNLHNGGDVAAGQIRGFEEINLSNTKLSLNLEDILSMGGGEVLGENYDHLSIIKGDGLSSVSLGDTGLSKTGTTEVAGISYDVFTNNSASESAESVALLIMTTLC